MRLFSVLSSLLWVVMMVCACQPAPVTVSIQAATSPPTRGAVLLATAVPITAVPTYTLTPTPSRTSPPTVTTTSSPTPIPLTPSVTPTLQPVDFYAFRRPFNRDQIDYADRTYPYGMGELRGLPVHHGLDFADGRGTQVLAIGNGTVYYAGQDRDVLFGPIPDYYGTLVVIQHDITSLDGLPVYSLYGHLQRVDVTVGQRVKNGERIGSVGDTGVAFDPHLHLEIRVGDPYSFASTRNPDLWILPYPQFGTLAGRMMYDDGSPVYEGTITVRRLGIDNATLRYAYSYNADPTIIPDSVWHENFTLGDLPVDRYTVFVSDQNGRVLFKQDVSIEAGKTSFVEVVIPR